MELLNAADQPVDGDDPRALSDRSRTPLSRSQLRFWYLSALAPESPVCNVPTVLRLSGPISPERLQTAVDAVLDRHEILRCQFRIENGQPTQTLVDSPQLPVTVIDLRDDALGEQKAAEHIDRHAVSPIDVTSYPLVVAKLYRLSDDDAVFFWMPHHIVWDAWSLDIFLDELSQAYCQHDNASEQKEALSVQFGDYAAWQSKRFDADADDNFEFWDAYLDKAVPQLDLPHDNTRPRVMSYDGAQQRSEFESESVVSFHQFARDQGATPFMVLLAAFYVLLYRYSSQTDIVVGSPIQDRNFRGSERVIGPFVNNLVLRLNLNPDWTFNELLAAVRDLCLTVYERQDMPFDELAKRYAPDNGIDRTPLYQTLISYQNVTNRTGQIGDCSFEEVSIDKASAQTDLALWFLDSGDTIKFGFDYATDLFDGQRIERMMEHFSELLDAALAEPGARCRDLPMLTNRETAALSAFSKGPSLTVPYASVEAAFENTASRYGTEPAVICGGQTTSYSELNAKSNSIAAKLAAEGIGAGSVVGVCLPRTTTMISSLLAVFKLGATYVPLDATHPTARLAYIVEHCGVDVILTNAENYPSLAETSATLLDCTEWITDDRLQIPSCSAPGDIAYVMYTSGSTGKPKGVEVLRSSVANLLYSMQEITGFGPGNSLLAVTTIAFDISVLELFLPLLSGGTVVLASSEEAHDPRLLSGLIAEHDPDMCQATPSLWRMLKDYGWTGSRSLTVLSGGEPLEDDLGTWLLGACSRVFNVYGPTESTVWSTAKLLKKDGSRITIGTPIHNTQTYVLDENMQPAPIGVPGRLFIGGDGLAKAYRKQPDLTAERFRSHPATNERIYDTGDDVFWSYDGELRFMGRSDLQVKVRGHRIELGEIESVLNSNSDVTHSVVCTHEYEPGDVRLVAYIVPTEGSSTDSIALRKWLSTKLPGYMLPHVFFQLDALPLTPNKKIDRSALQPLTESTSLRTEIDEPETTLERSIAQLWERLLGTEKISRHDNFFAIGGHSLLAVQFTSELLAQENVSIPLRMVVLQDLAAIAKFVDTNQTGSLNDDEAGKQPSLLRRLFG